MNIVYSNRRDERAAKRARRVTEAAQAAHRAHEARGGQSLTDQSLEADLFSRLDALERAIDNVAPTPLRHELSNLIVQMRTEIWKFDQSKSPWR
jgi:hypothetical protein